MQQWHMALTRLGPCDCEQADATGALEAVKAAVGVLPQDRVQPRFLLAAAADITTSDVDLAFASGALILGFNIQPSEAVQAAAKQYGVCPRAPHLCPWHTSQLTTFKTSTLFEMVDLGVLQAGQLHLRGIVPRLCPRRS